MRHCVLCVKAPHLPGVEVEGGEFAEVAVGHVDVEALGLVNEGASVGGHVYKLALLDLPHSLVQGLQVLWDVQLLYHATSQEAALPWQANSDFAERQQT